MFHLPQHIYICPGSVAYNMSFLFGGSTTKPSSNVDSCKRVVRKAVHRLSIESMRLERQEKGCINTLRQAAKNGNRTLTKSTATDLVRLRASITNNHSMQGKFNGMAMQANSLAGTNELASSLTKLTSAMQNMNTNTDLSNISQIVANFERESEMTLEKQNIIDDGLADVGAVDNEDDIADNEISKLLTEFGLELQLPAVTIQTSCADDDDDRQLAQRIEMLKT
jgi:charged multivesicular body protein 2A